MSSNSSQGGKLTPLKTVRYGVGYAERFVKNFKSQVKWTWDNGKWAHEKITHFYNTHSATHPAWIKPCVKWLSIVALTILGGFLMKFLFVWALLKSI